MAVATFLKQISSKIIFRQTFATTTRVASVTALHHANTVLNDGTVIDHHSNFAASDKGVYALSEACIRFARPYGAMRTGGLEYPSLFNPYWRASLATVSKASRLLADVSKGLPESALLEGAGSCT
jgi:hypothetical protein